MAVNSCSAMLDLPGDFSAWHITYSYQYWEICMIDTAPFSIPDGYPAVTNNSTLSSKKVPRMSEVTTQNQLFLKFFPFKFCFLSMQKHLECKTDGKMGTLLTMLRRFRPFDIFIWLRSFFSVQTNSITFFSLSVLKPFKNPPSYVLKAFCAQWRIVGTDIFGDIK